MTVNMHVAIMNHIIKMFIISLLAFRIFLSGFYFFQKRKKWDKFNGILIQIHWFHFLILDKILAKCFKL